MFKSLIVVTVIVLIAGGLSACGALRTFDALVPYDSGSQRIAKDVSFGDHPRQRLDVYTPSDTKKDQALPVIVFIHGGSWASGNKNEASRLIGQAHAIWLKRLGSEHPNTRWAADWLDQNDRPKP